MASRAATSASRGGSATSTCRTVRTRSRSRGAAPQTARGGEGRVRPDPERSGRHVAWRFVVRLRSRRSTGQELQLVLASHEWAAGGSFGGEVLGADEPVSITVVRIERSPSATLSFAVSNCEVAPVDGRVEFELPLPDWLPPGWSGEQTGLGYAGRAPRGPPPRPP